MPQCTKNERTRCLGYLLMIACLVCVAGTAAAQTNCQVPNCLQCAADNEFVCEVCAGPDFIKSMGQCSPRGSCGITGCEKCEEGTIARCQTCEPGYMRTTNGFCASLVVCNMDKCESQEELRDRIAQTAVECHVEETAKGEEVYMCVPTAADGGAGGRAALLSRVPWWLFAVASTVVALWSGLWMMPRLRRRNAVAA